MIDRDESGWGLPAKEKKKYEGLLYIDPANPKYHRLLHKLRGPTDVQQVLPGNCLDKPRESVFLTFC